VSPDPARLPEAYRRTAVARAYAGERWRGSRHARRTARREARLVARLLATCGPLDTALDVPCGTGRLLPLLGIRVPRLAGADGALEMLREARHQGPAPPLCVADAAHLPFASACTDLVLCMRLLHHFPAAADRRTVLAELARVSRRWVLVSYFDRASVQAWRQRRRPRARYPVARRDFAGDLAAAGLRERRRAWVARGWSEQVLVLAERA